MDERADDADVEILDPKTGEVKDEEILKKRAPHVEGPIPDFIKELMRGFWVNNVSPSKIAQIVNDMGVLSYQIHGNTVSQFISGESKRNPEIKEERVAVKEELVQASKDAVVSMRQHVIGKIKDTSLAVVDEVTDTLPTTIRNILAQLNDEDLKPSTIRELSVAMKIQIDVLDKLSGMDAARQLYIYEGKKRLDQQYGPVQPEDLKNVTPTVVQVSGWDGPEG